MREGSGVKEGVKTCFLEACLIFKNCLKVRSDCDLVVKFCETFVADWWLVVREYSNQQ